MQRTANVLCKHLLTFRFLDLMEKGYILSVLSNKV